MNKSLRPDTEARKKAAFNEAAQAIHKQFDGALSTDGESVGQVLQQLVFMGLADGGRLDREQSLRNLKIFNERLIRQMNALLKPGDATLM